MWKGHFSPTSARSWKLEVNQSTPETQHRYKGVSSEHWHEPLKPGGPNLYSLVFLGDYMATVTRTARFNMTKDGKGLESLD